MASINTLSNFSSYHTPPLHQKNNEHISEDNSAEKTSQDHNESKIGNDTENAATEKKKTTTIDKTELSKQEIKALLQLKKRDKEVKAHEMAHVSAGAQYITKRATYEYERGPDGQRYAIGGEVSIDISEVTNDPQATIKKMKTVQKAALAPASPSSADRNAAAAATRKEMQARMELTQRALHEQESRSTQNAYQKAGNSEESKGSLLDISI